MTPPRKVRQRGSAALATALVVTISALAALSAARAGDDGLAEATAEFMPGSEQGSTRPPATFFSINAVLAKLDSQRGRGPGAIRMASVTPSDVATDPLPTKEAPPVGNEPFGLFTFRAPDGMLWRRWRGLEADMLREQTILDKCRDAAETCPSNAAQFLRLIEAVKSKSGRERLDEANHAVNAAIRYVSDYAQHGEADRWSAPLATFATAKGDCEDYAIAKYVALREAGFPQQELRLVLVRDRAVRQDHAVLAARLDGHWLILDNRRSELIEDRDASNFTPLFAINHDGVHLFAAPYAKRPLLADEAEATPAAASIGPTGWDGLEVSSEGSSQRNTRPILM